MTNDEAWAPKTLEAWAFVQKMIGDITSTVTADAENERELLEGLGVVSRATRSRRSGRCTAGWTDS